LTNGDTISAENALQQWHVSSWGFASRPHQALCAWTLLGTSPQTSRVLIGPWLELAIMLYFHTSFILNVIHPLLPYELLLFQSHAVNTQSV